MIRPTSSIACALAVVALATRAYSGFPTPATGLVSYWPFDGDLADVQGDQHGTWMGTQTTPKYAAGKFGAGLDLDGTDQFVETTGDRLTLYTYRHGVSVSAWFRVDGFTKGWQTLISSPDASVARLGRERTMFFGPWPENQPIPEILGGRPNLDDGEWHHLAAVGYGGRDPSVMYSFDPGPPTWDLWVDGKFFLRRTGESYSVGTGWFYPVGTSVEDSLSMPVYIGNNPEAVGRSWDGLIDDVAIWDYGLSADQIAQIWNKGEGAAVASLSPPLGLGLPPLQAGDADQDLDFDQMDLVEVLQAAKYLTAEPATWGEGDWDVGTGGYPGGPPPGDGVFDQQDIVAALQTGSYLSGPYAGIGKGGVEDDEQTSIIYDANTGEIGVNCPANTWLTSLNIDSASGIFVNQENVENLGGSFDNISKTNIFWATFQEWCGPPSFGYVASRGLSEDFVANDLAVVGSLAGGRGLGDVDLIYIPEPPGVGLATFGAALVVLVWRQGKRTAAATRSRAATTVRMSFAREASRHGLSDKDRFCRKTDCRYTLETKGVRQ